MAALPNSKIQYVSSALWAMVAAYPGAGSVAAGTLCTNTANSPAVGSERVFVCTVGGVSLGTAPTFTTTKGALTQEGATGIFWQECTGQPGVNGDITNSPIWIATSTVVVGQIIYVASNGSLQIVKTASGNTLGSIPAFSATAGVTTNDSSNVWTSLGLASSFGKFAAPHARITNADAVTWQTVVPAQIFIDSNHAETSAAATNLVSGQANSTLQNQYLSVSASGSIPPTSCTAGAGVNTTGANNITISALSKLGYYYGITFNAGSSSNAASIVFQNTTATTGLLILDNCTFVLNNTSASSQFTVGQQFGTQSGLTRLINPTFTFGATTQGVTGYAYGAIEIIGGSFAATGSVPTTLFSSMGGGSASNIFLARDVDLSKITGALGNFSPNSTGYCAFENCKLGANVSMPTVGNYGAYTVILDNCDSGSKNYRFYRANTFGSMVQETSIVRTGGATDGVQQLSWNITPISVSPAVSAFGHPFSTEYLPVVRYNTLTTGSHTATVYLTSNAVLTNANFWAELECLDTSGFPIGTIVTSRVADPLTTPTGLTTDSSTWGGTAQTYKYKIVLIFSPAMAGVIKVRLFAATGATTSIYVDPNVILDSLTSARQYIMPGMGYFNDEAINSGTPIFQSAIIEGLGAI